jgi:ankyrin repeat protein
MTLLAQAAPITLLARRKQGVTPLHEAAQEGQADALQCLLDVAASFEATAAPAAPPHTPHRSTTAAASAPHDALAHATDALAVSDDASGGLHAAPRTSDTPSSSAAASDAGVSVSAMLSARTDEAHGGYTPLLLAVAFGHVDMIDTLLAAKADASAAATHGTR